jgi:hypothetical protein
MSKMRPNEPTVSSFAYLSKTLWVYFCWDPTTLLNESNATLWATVSSLAQVSHYISIMSLLLLRSNRSAQWVKCDPMSQLFYLLLIWAITSWVHFCWDPTALLNESNATQWATVSSFALLIWAITSFLWVHFCWDPTTLLNELNATLWAEPLFHLLFM